VRLGGGNPSFSCKEREWSRPSLAPAGGKEKSGNTMQTERLLKKGGVVVYEMAESEGERRYGILRSSEERPPPTVTGCTERREIIRGGGLANQEA